MVRVLNILMYDALYGPSCNAKCTWVRRGCMSLIFIKFNALYLKFMVFGHKQAYTCTLGSVGVAQGHPSNVGTVTAENKQF